MSHTGNPRHPNNPPSDPAYEPTGAVTKDSLANESIARGQGFSDNPNPGVLGVKGHQSTLNNTDTSNADVIPPASSGSARDQASYQSLGSDERGSAGGLRYPDADANQTSSYGGTTSDQGYRGGSGDASLSGTGSSYNTSSYSGASAGAFDDKPSSASGGPDSNIRSSGSGVSAGAGTGASSGTGARPYVDSAPNYTGTDEFRSGGTYQPKGDNLTEGGDVPPNRSTFTGDVGGPNDPGRLAERNFQKNAYDTSAGQVRDYGSTGAQGNQYDDLNPNERA